MTSRPGSPKRSLLRLGVAGAVAVGATFALAGTANAAPDSAWDELAQCESGGNWEINTGNGFYGGLQFKPTTWRAFGGSGLPHHASREQQIAVAERTLAAQGWNAWPSCSRKMGLRGNAAEPTRMRASAPAKATRPDAARVAENGADYTVAAGDTLSKIAAAQKVSGGWQGLFERNRDVLSSPHVLRVGQQLDLS
ncbi:transglycosylase family protein [Pseudonocardia aurantiaca]|uniref:Transglycosylase family protein n=1 Tax=Pseudonocardia aurantiaca TaxID=75290 RepID=A0ABW4FTI0_9PSEU